MQGAVYNYSLDKIFSTKCALYCIAGKHNLLPFPGSISSIFLLANIHIYVNDIREKEPIETKYLVM